MLKAQREQAIKARTMRAAAYAPSFIRPPPPAEEDSYIVSKFDCELKSGDELNFATLERDSNLCVEHYFVKTGGDDGNRWSDEEDGDDLRKKKRDHHEDGDDDEEEEEIDEMEQLRRWKREHARPRSAAERCLNRPGHQMSSFTQKMLRFANNKKK